MLGLSKALFQLSFPLPQSVNFLLRVVVAPHSAFRFSCCSKSDIECNTGLVPFLSLNLDIITNISYPCRALTFSSHLSEPSLPDVPPVMLPVLLMTWPFRVTTFTYKTKTKMMMKVNMSHTVISSSQSGRSKINMTEQKNAEHGITCTCCECSMV